MTSETMHRDPDLPHAPLLQRLSVILESLALPHVAHICDARQAAHKIGPAVVGLVRAGQQSITRKGPSR